MPNNPPSASVVTPPWLAKLNSLNEQVDSAISHAQPNPMQSPSPVAITQTQIEPEPAVEPAIVIRNQFDPESIVPDQFGVHAPSAIPSHELNPIQVPDDLPSGYYHATVNESNVVTPVGVAIQFDAVAFQQSIGRGSRGDSDAEAVSGGKGYADPDHRYAAEVDVRDMDSVFGKLGPTSDLYQSPIKEDPLLSDDEIPGMPTNWKPPVEVELPEVGDAGAPLVQPAAEVVEYESADTNQPRVSEEEYYAAIVALIGQSNPDEAKLIGRLRLFQSQFVGLITSPEQAIDHIAQCRAANIPVGGSEAVDLSPQAVSLKHKQYIDRRYAPHRAKKAAVESARQDWKKAIADRDAAILQWDTFVKWHHDNYNRIRALPADVFLVEQPKEEANESH